VQQQFATVNLATLLEEEGKRSEAIVLLEETGRRRRDLTSLSVTWWMRGRAELARLYRKNGQIREAEAIEAHLLKLLAVADADHLSYWSFELGPELSRAPIEPSCPSCPSRLSCPSSPYFPGR
jgi:hypothetical protein